MHECLLFGGVWVNGRSGNQAKETSNPSLGTLKEQAGDNEG
jgi:hypothetical protein